MTKRTVPNDDLAADRYEAATIERFHAMFPNAHFYEVDSEEICKNTPLWKAARAFEKLRRDIDARHGMREIAEGIHE